ncbi:hypothetical protein DL93DRAFT_2164034 [Clavulina sp. PMI_390]|nr:hypothetical protein DL93DRAFT_2164034 [Clavulina sp. PMI_390]
MSLALSRNSTAMWILNVGDLKPNELNIEFFHALGYQPSLFTPNNIESWVAKWATREFGLNTIQSNNIATIVANLTRYSARRKPELMNTTVFSLTNYHEAERVLTEWQTLYDASLAIYNALPSLTKPAFFQLVHHPITGFLQTYNLWIAAGRNNLFASQIRTSANDQADLALSWFNAAWELENEYHTMLDGKWDQMMSQPHIGYVYWQQPLGNSMPPVNRIMAQKPGMSGPMRMTLESRLGAWPGDNQNNCAQGYNCPDPVMDPLDPYMPTPSRYVDLSLAGPAGVTWKATTNATWLTITPSSGSLSTSHNEQRVVLTANWAKVGSEESLAQIVFTPTNAKNVSWLGPMNVYLPAIPRSVPAGFHGVVEGDGGISIEASSYTKITPSTVGNATWIVLPGFGRTKDAVTISPNDGSTNYTIGSGPSVQYSFYNFDSYANNTAYLTTYVSPSMNANGADQPLAFALQVDGGTPVRVQPVGPNVPGQFPTGWGSMTGPQSNNIIPTLTNITIAPGAHTLTLWGIESAVVIQKFVIDTGNVRTSYLGPPASIIV